MMGAIGNCTMVDHPFNHFVMELDKDPSAKGALAFLESKELLNPNMVLFCIWHSRQHLGRLHKADIKLLLQNIHSWHERVSLPLKQLENMLSSSSIKQLALIRAAVHQETSYAEYIERLYIADSDIKSVYRERNTIQQLNDACFNLTNYRLQLKIRPDEITKNAVLTLLQLSFTELSPEKILSAYDNFVNNLRRIHELSFSQLSLQSL